MKIAGLFSGENPLGTWRVWLRGPEANSAVIGAQLVGMLPPGIIFTPG